jgi:uncharacterized RDD family membrane protein YckC
VDQFGTHDEITTDTSKLAILIIVGAIVGFVYEWLMIGLKGQTLGKMAVKVKVVNEDTGGPVGLFGAFKRQILPTLVSFIPLVGSFAALLIYLSIFFDSTKRLQGWHDKFTNDLVISTRLSRY